MFTDMVSIKEQYGYIMTFTCPLIMKFFIHELPAEKCFTQACTTDIKEMIFKSFTIIGSKLRTAFGIVIDSPDIRRIIHFSPPSDVEAYVQ